MLTYLMLGMVIVFALILRGRYHHKDDYRYEAAEYFVMAIIWGLIALSSWNEFGMAWRCLYVFIIVYSIYRFVKIILDHQ